MSAGETAPRTIHFVSLGCPKNRVDTEVMLGVAEESGYQQVDDPATAGVIVVNTCGFIDAAKEESLQTILELSAHKQTGACERLVVTGCLSQRYPEELAEGLPEVDHLLGSSDMLKLRRVLEGAAERILVGNPADWVIEASDPRRISTRGRSAYVKIAEGCNRRCSFCVIPEIRGKQRSRAADDVVREVERLVAQGVLEINLVSQDTLAYGRDRPSGDNLPELVRRVADVAGVHWVRLFYLYPEKLDERLIELLAEHPRVVPYVDMPLQHAADAMLRRMRRGHGGKRLYELVERLRTRIPELVLRSAFIVGHPGETEAEFEELLAFVRFAELDRMAVFHYSDEPSAHAYALPGKVNAKTILRRGQRLSRVQRAIGRRKARALVGRRLEVLVEGPDPDEELVLVGRHAGQAPEIDGSVYLSGGDVRPGELCQVRITEAADHDLLGEVEDAPRAPAAPESTRAVRRAANGRVALRTLPGTVLALALLALGCSAEAPEAPAQGTAAIDLPLPDIACLSPLPEGPIWFSAGRLEPELAIALEPGRHHLLQFRHAPSEADRAELSNLGIELFDPVPEGAYFASVATKLEEPAALPIAGGIARAFPLMAEHKLDPALLGKKGAFRPRSAAVHWFADTPKNVRNALRRVPGVKVLRQVGQMDVVRASPRALRALARLDFVQFVEPFVQKSRLHSRAGEIAHNAGALYEPPLSLSGEGVAVAVFDAGWADFDHPDLAGRVFHDPSLLTWRGTPFLGSGFDRKHDHATGMTGIIASSGAGNPAARGTAPEASVYSYILAYEYLNPEETLAGEAERHGWRVANHSYGRGFPCSPAYEEPCKGDPRWTSYIPDARFADVLATQAGVLNVYSAGNDGLQKNDTFPEWLDDNWQTIYSGGVGKNAISVCAATPSGDDPVFSVRADSAKGPASDGRVKPDLCALGDRLPAEPTMTTALGGGYRETYATSPAAAEVSGAAALLHERYTGMFPGSDSMAPALAKGLLLHTARDMDENAGRWIGTIGEYRTAHTTPGPDYTSGWGFLDLGAAMSVLDARSWYAGLVGSARQNDYVTAELVDGEELRVTLIWDDLPGSVGTGRALVNQVDLVATNLETGTVHRPFILHPLVPTEAATRGTNTVDNVEQVRFVHEGRPAPYLLEVIGTDVTRRVQSYFVITSHALTRPALIVEERRFRDLAQADELANNLHCRGLFVRGPDFELTRRLSVTLENQKVLVTPFADARSGDLQVVPLGDPFAGAIEKWADLDARLEKEGLEKDDDGFVIRQKRVPDGPDAPVAMRWRDVAGEPQRLELALAELGW